MGGRGKVVLARITDEKKRKETMKKRKAGLMKKVSELATLCGAEAALVVYGRGENQPTVWPSASEAKATISKFLRRPELERKARTHSTKSLTEQKCKKLKNKAERLKKKNDTRMAQALITFIHDDKIKIQDLDSEKRKMLNDFADDRKKELLKHIQRLKRKEKQATQDPPVQQMAPEAARGLYINGDGGVRNSTLRAAATNGQLMNLSGMTRLAPPLSLYNRQTPNPLLMPLYDSAAYTRNLTGRAASGLNMNALASGRYFPSPAEGHGQEMIRRGLTPVANVPSTQQTPNQLVMAVPNNSTGNRLNMTRVYGQTNIGGVMQHPLPSTLYMQPTAPLATQFQVPPPDQQLKPVNQPASGLNRNYHTGGRNISSPAATTRGELMNVHGMTQLAPPPPSYLPTPDLLVMSHNNSEENRLDITGRLHGRTNIGSIMQHPLALPSPSSMPPPTFVMSNLQSMASRLDTTIDGFTNLEEVSQHVSPPFLPVELPRRLGLTPMHYNASGIDTISNGNRWDTTGFTTPGATLVNQSSFGDAYRSNADGFSGPATPGFNQSNFGNGPSNGILWDDFDSAFEVNTAPH